MTETTIEQMATSPTGGSGKIHLDLNDQEQLILTAHNISIAATNLTAHVSSVIKAIPNLVSVGIFKNYIGDQGDLSLYSLKAQELQTLTEIIHQFSFDTYETMVNADNLMALEIGNMTLNTDIPSTSSVGEEEKNQLLETQTLIRTNPGVVFEALKEQGG